MLVVVAVARLRAGGVAKEEVVALLNYLYLLDQGVLQRVGPFMGHGEVLAELAADVRGWLRSEGSFTPSQAKERWGLTRKHLIPLLEWLDARRVTRRIGDARRAGTG